MGKSVEAGRITDIAEGQMKAVSIEGRQILLANVGGRIYAVSNKCPHFGGNLSQGKLEGKTVTCPLHGSQFDVTNGKVVRWLKGSGLMSSIGKSLKSPSDLERYDIRLEDNKIFIDL